LGIIRAVRRYPATSWGFNLRIPVFDGDEGLERDNIAGGILG